MLVHTISEYKAKTTKILVKGSEEMPRGLLIDLLSRKCKRNERKYRVSAALEKAK